MEEVDHLRKTGAPVAEVGTKRFQDSPHCAGHRGVKVKHTSSYTKSDESFPVTMAMMAPCNPLPPASLGGATVTQSWLLCPWIRGSC